LPSECNVHGKTLAVALIAIRDAGGEWLAGEKLPEPCEETWPTVRFGRDFFCCGQCGIGVPSHPKDNQCPECNTKLSGEVPWNPYPPNKD